MEEKKLYRDVSLNKLNSAEQLNDYIKVASPGVWMIITAVIILIVGALIYAGMTSIETSVEACVEVEDGKMTAYVIDSDVSLIKANTMLVVDDDNYSIASLDDIQTLGADEKESKFIAHMLPGADDEKICVINMGDSELEDGYYLGEFPIESVTLKELIFESEE